MGNLPSGIVTFLFTDIEGSTRRWVEDPSMRTTLARHDELTTRAIADHGGHRVKHTGDGVMAVFASPSAALAAAGDLQRALLVADWGDRPLRVRAGVHTAEAHPDGDDYFGPEVSTAARVMGAAHGGQVLVSEATAGVTRGALVPPIGLIDLGAFHLPDLGRPLRLHQLTAPGIPDTFPPPRSRETTPTNLPTETTSFVGRETERREVAELLGNRRSVTLTGVGGAGKTRLAVRVARDVLAHFPDGVWLVELASTTDPDDVVDRVADALEIGDTGDGTTADRIAQHVGDRDLLLLLDNCEHVLEAAASVVDHVLRSGPQVRVLATSREALGIGGEATWRVPSMGVERRPDGTLGDAVALFEERAHAAAPGFAVSAASAETVVEVCRRLDGIPLAIELAAARVGSLGLDQVRRRLDDRFRILTGGSRTALPRQQTLTAAIDWSHRLLDDVEQALFARLSVFVGGFDLDAAEAVCADARVPADTVVDALSSLVEKSMVVADPADDGTVRYRLLETLRQYARQQMADADQEPLRRRHRDWYLDRFDGVIRLVAFDAAPVVAEIGNLQAAHDWSVAVGDDASASRLAASLSTAAVARREESRALQLVEEALERGASRLDPVDEALLELRWAQLAYRAGGSRDDARAAMDRGERLVERVPASPAKVAALRRLSSMTLALVDQDPADGVPFADEAVRVADAVGDPHLRVTALGGLATALGWAGRPEAGERVGLEAVALADPLDDELRFLALDGLLFASFARGGERYRAHGEAAIAAFPPTDDRWAEEYLAAHGAFFWTLIRLGRLDEADEVRARVAARHDFEGWDRIGDLVARGMLRWMWGRLEEADTDVRSIGGEAFIERWAHDALPLAADVAADLGELDRVREVADRYFALDVHAAELPMQAGVVFPHVRAEVEAILAGTGGDLGRAEASLDRVRGPVRARDHHLAIQIEPTHAYLAMAEAELTRAGEPSPEAWGEARAEAVTEYWRAYTEIRWAEASLMVREPARVDLAAARANAERMGARRLVGLADAVAHSAGDRPS